MIQVFFLLNCQKWELNAFILLVVNHFFFAGPYISVEDDEDVDGDPESEKMDPRVGEEDDDMDSRELHHNDDDNDNKGTEASCSLSDGTHKCLDVIKY